MQTATISALILLLGIFQVSAEIITPNSLKPVTGLTMNHLTLTEEDKDKTFNIAEGDSLVIQLRENPTTGYVWAMTGYDDVLILQESSYTPVSAAIGSNGTRRFLLLAKKPGTITLKLKQWREWEGDASIVEAFSIGIQVQAK